MIITICNTKIPKEGVKCCLIFVLTVVLFCGHNKKADDGFFGVTRKTIVGCFIILQISKKNNFGLLFLFALQFFAILAFFQQNRDIYPQFLTKNSFLQKICKFFQILLAYF